MIARMKLKIEEYDIGAVEAAMHLRDIEICSFGLTSLRRQGCRFLCPETKPFSTSPDKSVQGARQHCNRQGLRMETLRQAANVQSAAYLGTAAILAVFILTFAMAPKARAQDNGHHPRHAAHHCKWYSQAPMRETFRLRQIRPPELPLFSPRS